MSVLQVLFGPRRKVELPPHWTAQGDFVAPIDWYRPEKAITIKVGRYLVTLPGRAK